MDGKTFNEYVLPVKNIDWGASNVNGMTKNFCKLFVNGVKARSVNEALQLLSEWLQSIKALLFLVGRNSKTFDSQHLWKVVAKHKMKIEFNIVVGFMDTLLFSENTTQN